MHRQPANPPPVHLLSNRIFAYRNVMIFTDGQDTVDGNAKRYNAFVLDARIFSDPGASLVLRRHDGAHPEIISRLSNHAEFSAWIQKALAQLRDWMEKKSGDELRIIVYCRAGKHRSRACALVLQHCFETFNANVTVQHLSGKQCWESQKGNLCKYCSHLGDTDRHKALKRAFDIIYGNPNNRVEQTPKAKAMPKRRAADSTCNNNLMRAEPKPIPKKRSADVAMQSNDSTNHADSSCDRLASGRLKARHETTANQSTQRIHAMGSSSDLMHGSEVLTLLKVLRSYLGICGTDKDQWETRWRTLEQELDLPEDDLKRAIKTLVGHGNGSLQDRHLSASKAKRMKI